MSIAMANDRNMRNSVVTSEHNGRRRRLVSDATVPVTNAEVHDMIVRMWFGRARTETADSYAEHVTQRVLPSIATISGHRGALVLRRNAGRETEFAVLTMWDSLDAVKQFAGPEPDVAVVEPAAKALLSTFDDTVRHFEVIYES
jgi:heme-degrading monooxygenase HmoA